MKRIHALLLCAIVACSALGCVVRTQPEYAHRHHRHTVHREVVVVHRY